MNEQFLSVDIRKKLREFELQVQFTCPACRGRASDASAGSGTSCLGILGPSGCGMPEKAAFIVNRVRIISQRLRKPCGTPSSASKAPEPIYGHGCRQLCCSSQPEQLHWLQIPQTLR